MLKKGGNETSLQKELYFIYGRNVRGRKENEEGGRKDGRRARERRGKPRKA